LDFHTIFEGFYVELFKEGSLRSLNLFVLGAHLEVLGNLDLSFNDFGGDVEGVEKVNLRGVKSCGASWDSEVDGRDNTNSCLSGNFVGLNFSSEVIDGGFGEDEGNLLLQ